MLTVPPSEPAGGEQPGSHETKLTPVGSATETTVLVAVDGPALRNETTKFTNWVVATGSDYRQKRRRSDPPVESVLVSVKASESALESALVKVAVSRSKSS